MKNEFFKIVNDSRLTSHHVSLYLALFTKYLEEGVEFEICPQQVMKQAKIRTRETYGHCLNQLNNWGYLVYSPGTNQHLKSKVKFVIQENHTGNNSAVQENHTGNNSAIQENHTGNNSATQENHIGNHSAIQETHTGNNFAIQENHTGRFNNSTDYQQDNSTTQKNRQTKTAPNPKIPSSSSSLMKSININLVNSIDDVVAENDVPRSKLKISNADHPFTKSPYFDWPTFQAALSNSNRHQNVDLRFYYDALSDWRDRTSGLPPLRSDWLRTARVFMRNDAQNQKLALVNEPQIQKSKSSTYQPEIINNEKYRRTE